MSESKFELVQQIFLSALEQPSEVRDAWLREQCASDAELYSEVSRLLEQDSRTNDPLEQPLKEVLGELPTSAATSAVPPTQSHDGQSTGTSGQIGPYKLLQRIGEGGMGSVYMAEQQTPIKRRVALKVIKPGLDSRQVVARFEAERQALALMDHPNIAKVFDAGQTEEGQPYFVMELVNGVSITQFCDEEQLTPKQRLELFIPICEAVQHAHQKGVIHRDLKPSNILIARYDANPVPKIIDFGISKATSGELTEKTLFTNFGQIVGTLEYMSPEQALPNQIDVDTRSDIYSLGVVLYELLTGGTPLERNRIRSRALDEIMRLIREEEPPKPSVKVGSSESSPSVASDRRVTPQKLTSMVRGELDWIVMKAIEKERSRRYETANAFAMDLKRYLNDDAVEAGPPSRRYQLKRFATKHRGILAVLTTLAVILLASASFSIWFVIRAVSARDLAKLESERTQSASIETSIETLLISRGNAVSQALEFLLQLPRDKVIEELRTRYVESELQDKLAIAYALAEIGEPDIEFLVNSIADAQSDECQNIVRALKHDTSRALQLLTESSDNASGKEDWQVKGRLAMIALHLGDDRLAVDIHADRPDPTQQTIFIHEVFPSFHADLIELAKAVQNSNDAPLRAGMCLAVGNLSVNDVDEGQDVWGSLFETWYLNSPDSATHSASAWAIRNWNIDLPNIAVDTAEPLGRNWKVTALGKKHGFTMLRLPKGQFVRSDVRTRQVVGLTKDFWLSDTEVTNGAFQEFMSDEQYHAKAPDLRLWWYRDGKVSSDREFFPASDVSWQHAILFCNWLSKKEGKTPCYEISVVPNAKEQIGTIGLMVSIKEGTDGYRLPTEAEWEYACRAGTSTNFSFGEAPNLLKEYSTLDGNGVQRIGIKMSNRWGLFDCYGNVFEWCFDWLEGYYPDDAVLRDPKGPDLGWPLHRKKSLITDEWFIDTEDFKRIKRGGTSDRPMRPWTSGKRGAGMQSAPAFDTGFRIAQASVAS